MASSLDQIRNGLAPYGLGHVGAVSAEDYDRSASKAAKTSELAPWARSVLVVASGGPAMWHAFVADLQRNPEHLTGSADPLDDFVHRSVQQMGVELNFQRHRWCFSNAHASVHLDFRSLAVQAGIGSSSRLGLVLHPEYGPWMGLRAACFMSDVLEPTGPIDDLCGGCPAPCATVCPGDAFVEGHWDVGLCADFHRTSTVCAQACDARKACVVGGSSQYPPLEILYHYDRRAGRAALREFLGIDADQDAHEGVGPHWGGWDLASADEDVALD